MYTYLVEYYFLSNTLISYRKKIKSVLLLVGFLGLTNSIFCINPKDGRWMEIIYLYGIAITQGLQVKKFVKINLSETYNVKFL